MSHIILYAHGGSGNHGCEAIVRSTAKILHGHNLTLISSNPEEDHHYGIAEFAEVVLDTDGIVVRRSLDFVKAYAALKLRKDFIPMEKLRYKRAFDHIRKGDIAMSIGGDNYCYADACKYTMFHGMAKARGARTVLWGCSVEPELLKQAAVEKDLASYDLITARETISYEALKEVNQNTVLVADPAFTLKRVDLSLPEGWIEGKMIGVNASPLILQSGKDSTLVLDAYKVLIQRILDTTDCSVALIPHVVWENNDDRVPLEILHDAFRDTRRIILLDDHNCMELKGYIARCRMFIGARTHATIAAYSTCVPTLVLGYSVKSRGIARDLFGTEENYVLPVQELSDSHDLVKRFEWLLSHEHQIRDHLKTTIPEYSARAYAAKEAIDSILP